MKIHLIGIGGIGISAIARFLLHDGHEISGSDIKANHLTQELQNEGATLTIPHDASAIADQELVIHSAIIKENNPEILAAKEKGIKIMHRKEALEFMLKEKEVFAVAGAHGKSTTTAILAAILDCTTLIGAESKAIGSNVRFCEGNRVVFEADESDASFLFSNPYCAVVTNAEPEHMEYYHYDESKFYDAYREFLNLAKHRVINSSDQFLNSYKENAIKIEPEKDIKNISYRLIENEPYSRFEFKDFGFFDVWGLGDHIALDASLAIKAASIKMDIETIRTNLLGYKGIKKRFDILSTSDQVIYIDDYAHHPTEVEATINSAKIYADLLGTDKITAIWQPHKYSRTANNLERFVESFAGVSNLVILPVWAAGEEPISIDFEAHFARYSPLIVGSVEEAKAKISLTSGLVIGFGAGDITYQMRALAGV